MGRGACHAVCGMKVTLDIVAELLQRVIDESDPGTKANTVVVALRETDRRERFKEFAENSNGWMKSGAGRR